MEICKICGDEGETKCTPESNCLNIPLEAEMKMNKNKECQQCEGAGKVYFSCCGDDVKGTIYEDYGICPTCKEHLTGEYEDCEECNGTGFITESQTESLL